MNSRLPLRYRLLFSLLGGTCLAAFGLFLLPAFADATAKILILLPCALLVALALFTWQSWWHCLAQPKSHLQRLNLYVLWLLLAGLLFGLTTHLTPNYWRVVREHVIALCPDLPEIGTPSQQHAPVLLGIDDLANQRAIPLQQLVGLPTLSSNPDGQPIDHCWRVRLPDTFAQDESYRFRFDAAQPANIRVRVTINSIVEDDNAPSLRRFYDPAIHSDGSLLFPNVSITGHSANLAELGKLLVKGLLLLVAAFTLAVALLALARSAKLDDVPQARRLGVASTLFIAYGLQQQLHPRLVTWFQHLLGGQPWWLWLIEAQLLVLTALLMVLVYRRNPLAALATHLQTLTKGQGLALMAFSVLFGTLLVYATLPFSRFFLFNEGMRLLFILAIFLLAVTISRHPQSVPTPTPPAQPHAWRCVLRYALPFLLVSFFYWLVFWPGLMYTDTAQQFEQIYQGTFNTHHPIVHTLLLWLLTRLWPSQGAVVVLQILAYSLVMGLFGWRMQVHGKPRWLIWGVIALLVAYPGSNIMAVTVIKGSLHGICLIATALLLLEIYYSHGAWLLRPRNCALLVLTVLFSAFFRHNGLLELVPSLVLSVLFFRRYARQLLVISGSVLLLYVSTIALIGALVNIDSGFSGFPIQMQYVYRSYLHQGHRLREQAADMLSYFPAETTLDMNLLYHSVRVANRSAKAGLNDVPQYNFVFKQAYPTPALVSLLAQEILSNPLPMLTHVYYTSRIMWVPVTPTIRGDGMFTPTAEHNLYLMEGRVYAYAELQGVDSRLPALLAWVDAFSNRNALLQELIWRPGLYSLLLLFMAGVTFIRQRFDARSLLVWLPLLIHFALFTVFHLWSGNYRYHWAYIASIFLLTANFLSVQKAGENHPSEPTVNHQIPL